MSTDPRPLPIPPEWAPYRSGLPIPVPPGGQLKGGGVSFAAHLGKPLGAALWDDLVGRCRVEWLNVIGPSDEEKSIGTFPGTATVYVDAAGVVGDVHLHPR